ncbi:hypothetical protein ACOME3_009465 [Neoechinorhynchus agilis]
MPPEEQSDNSVRRYLNILRSQRRSHRTAEIQCLQKELNRMSEELNGTKKELVVYKKKLEERESQVACYVHEIAVRSSQNKKPSRKLSTSVSTNRETEHEATSTVEYPHVDILRQFSLKDLKDRLAEIEKRSSASVQATFPWSNSSGDNLCHADPLNNNHDDNKQENLQHGKPTKIYRSTGTQLDNIFESIISMIPIISRTTCRSGSYPSFDDSSSSRSEFKRHSTGVDSGSSSTSSNNNSIDRSNKHRTNCFPVFSGAVENELRSCRFLLEKQQAELQEMQDSIKDCRELRSNEASFPDCSQASLLRMEVAELRNKNEKLSDNLRNAQHSLSSMKREAEEREARWKNEKEEYRNTLGVLEKELEDVIKEKAHAQVMWVGLSEEKKKMDQMNNEMMRSHDAEIVELKRKCHSLEKECMEFKYKLNEINSKYARELEEWKCFQRDLQVAVRVANDLKIEAEEKARHLEACLERANVGTTRSCNAVMNGSLAKKTADKDGNLDEYSRCLSAAGKTGSDMTYRHYTADITNVITNNRAPIKEMIRRIEMASGSISPVSERRPSGSDQPSGLIGSQRSLRQSVRTCFGTTTDDVKAITRSQSMKQDHMPFWQNGSRTKDRSDVFCHLFNQYPHHGGCRRNALLEWCRERIRNHSNIDVTNFSSSWSDGSALLALLHSYVPERIPNISDLIVCSDSRTRLQVGFDIAKDEGVITSLTVDQMMDTDRPHWEPILDYIIDLYERFEFSKNEETKSADL